MNNEPKKKIGDWKRKLSKSINDKSTLKGQPGYWKVNDMQINP